MGEKELTFGNNSQFLFPESTVPRVLAYKARLAIGNEQQFEQFYKSLETNLLFDNTTEASNHDGELFHIQWIKFQSQALSFSVDGKTSDCLLLRLVETIAQFCLSEALWMAEIFIRKVFPQKWYFQSSKKNLKFFGNFKCAMKNKRWKTNDAWQWS